VTTYSLLTVRRFRPLARRRLRTRRPFFVLMRTRKPCVRLRCRLLGWNVRFPFILGNSLRSGNERTMLANEFGRCQCGVVCVRVSILQDFSADPAEILRRPRQKRGYAFGLFPKFSTPVEKTVEIPIDLLFSLASEQILSFLSGRAKVRNGVKPGLSMR
jgi:hypothetical protein